MCPAVQVTVPEGVEAGGVFTLKPGSERVLPRFESGGGWRHSASEASAAYGCELSMCAPCFLAKMLALYRTGNRNAKYYYFCLPGRNCCTKNETACSICCSQFPLSCILEPLLWCCEPTYGINFTDFYKGVREELEIPHENTDCCCCPSSYEGSAHVAQIYMELRSRALLTEMPVGVTVSPATQGQKIIMLNDNELALKILEERKMLVRALDIQAQMGAMEAVSQDDMNFLQKYRESRLIVAGAGSAEPGVPMMAR